MPELEEALSALWCIGYRSTFRMRRLLGDCSFQSDFRVLPLGTFDVVIGMDWLAAYSTMQIH